MKKLAVLVAASLAATTLVVATATPVRADEARPSPVAAKVDKVFARLDADRDGRISRPEAEKGNRLANHFDKIDADRDGFVTRGELSAAIERARARHENRR
jgi:Ca2+-binding EF-hand superfamily protein